MFGKGNPTGGIKFGKSKLNVSPKDISLGRKTTAGNIGLAAPGMSKIQELISTKGTNPGSISARGGGSISPKSGIKLKKKRGLNLNAGNIPPMGV
ncbi:MAG TPA: hypothetical protein VNX68_04785 [Nitrosopumilaceae archaeon]|jgi:hypothetical protein|nr:hypothetical protein [Nitrosopumilaceae archaeon]